MIWPPNPGITGAFLADMAKLGWRSDDRQAIGFGTLADASSELELLVLTPEGMWSIVPCAPPGAPSFLLSRETFNVLLGSTLGPKGTVTFRERSYRLQARIHGIGKGEGSVYVEAVPT